MTKILYMIIPILLIIGGLHYLRKIQPDYGELLTEFGRCFLRKKAWILIFAVIYAVYCVGAKYVLTPQSAFATINLNYSGASKGLNPNKTRFNAADILNQEVLERAIEKGAFEGITPKELKNTLWLEALDVEPKVLDENTSEEKYKVGTVYRIHYTADEKTKNLNPEAVIQMVAYAYYDYFMDKYSDKRNLLRIPQEELDALENMDYLDMLNYFEMKSAELERYMIEYLSLNGKWQSQKEEETFASLRGKIDKFQDIELERFEAYILTNGMSKDSDRYVSKLQYENKMTDVKYQKDWSAYQVRMDAIDRYHRDMARVVLVPTEDEAEEFYMSRTKIGVDYLADEAEELLKSATDKQHKINTKEHAVQQLKNGKPTALRVEKINKMFEEIRQELLLLASEADSLIGEYMAEKDSAYLKMSFYVPHFFDIVSVRNLIIKIVLFMLAFDFYLTLREKAKAEMRQKKQMQKHVN